MSELLGLPLSLQGPLSKEIVLICIISETDMLVGPVLNPIHCFRLHELLNVVWLTMKILAGLFVCHAFSLLDSGIRYTWQSVSEIKTRTMLLQTWVNFFLIRETPKNKQFPRRKNFFPLSLSPVRGSEFGHFHTCEATSQSASLQYGPSTSMTHPPR